REHRSRHGGSTSSPGLTEGALCNCVVGSARRRTRRPPAASHIIATNLARQSDSLIAAGVLRDHHNRRHLLSRRRRLDNISLEELRMLTSLASQAQAL